MIAGCAERMAMEQDGCRNGRGCNEPVEVSRMERNWQCGAVGGWLMEVVGEILKVVSGSKVLCRRFGSAFGRFYGVPLQRCSVRRRAKRKRERGSSLLGKLDSSSTTGRPNTSTPLQPRERNLACAPSCVYRACV